jgi:hypothetical protein
VIITRAGSRWDGPLDLRTVCEVVAALAVGAALGLAAVRLLAEPATGGGSLSLVLGFLSGNFITDGLVKRRWWRLHDQTSRP